jgi:hypothetical protein
VYALGATLYELLTGRPAVPGDDKPEILRRITDGEPEPPRRLNPAVSADLETVVLKCLERAPADRYSTAGALAADLRLILENQSIPTRPRTWAHRAWRRAKARPALALRSVVVLAGALVAAAMLPPSPDRQRTDRERAIRTAVSEDRTFTLRKFGPGLAAFRWPMVAYGQGAAEETGRGLVLETLGAAALFEVTSNVGADAYRFGVKIRHERSSVNPRVGLYFGYREQEMPGGGRVGAYFSLGFADRKGPDPKGNWYEGKVALRVHVFSEARTGTVIDKSAPVGAEHGFDPAPNLWQVGGWREVAVEVRPTGVRVVWVPGPGREELVGQVTAIRLSQAALGLSQRFNHAPGLRFQFDSRSGIGVFLADGSAVVSEVTIAP